MGEFRYEVRKGLPQFQVILGEDVPDQSMPYFLLGNGLIKAAARGETQKSEYGVESSHIEWYQFNAPRRVPMT